ncbi:hypothetical protein G6F68_020692 [Rhizopus microsporus]|nr:hypothetical protein G6F68_020692 [Rhizopus microsporus]
MPSTYALLPGAFRVEINTGAPPGAALAPAQMRNLSWAASGTLSTAGTRVADSLATPLRQLCARRCGHAGRAARDAAGRRPHPAPGNPCRFAGRAGAAL